jgi:chloramphenicol O-acetyltransferase type A
MEGEHGDRQGAARDELAPAVESWVGHPQAPSIGLPLIDDTLPRDAGCSRPPSAAISSPAMSFRVLDDYPRRAHLEFFRRSPHPFYSLTFELDATRLRARARETGASVYAALIWAYHRALLGIDAFRTRLDGDRVVLHDSLRVGLTVPAPGRTFSFATVDWDADPERFLPAARAAMTAASAGVDLSGGDAPDFAYYTALPLVPFTSFAHVAQPDPTAGQPQAAFGRLREAGDRAVVPVGLQVNHLYVDGADLGELYAAASASFERAF